MNTAIINASYARRETHERSIKSQAHTQMLNILSSMTSAKFVVTMKNHFLILSMK